MSLNERIQALKRYLFRKQTGEKILRERYFQIHEKKLNLEAPQLFTEKLYHRMVMMHRKGCPTVTRLTDKYLARNYIQATVGEKYLLRLLWHGTDPHRIPFEALPAKVILQTNHGYGNPILPETPHNRDQIIQELSTALRKNRYWTWREPQYYGIPRQILIEELRCDGYRDGPLDYYVWCFNGKPELIQVDNRFQNINPFYTPQWEKISFFYRDNFENRDFPQPVNLEEMLSVAAELSAGFGFVRVDLYNILGIIYARGLNFTPSAGCRRLQPEYWDTHLGQLWTLEKSY